MSNTDDIELIEQYLNKQLDRSQVEAFELRLSQDKEFDQLYKEELSIYEAVADVDAQEFMQIVADVVDFRTNKVKTFQIFDRRLIAIAASILILLAASFLFRQSLDTDIMGEFFSPYPIVELERGDTKDDWNNFSQAYNNQNWQEVVKRGDTMSDPNAKLYVALAHMSLEDYDQAIRELKMIPEKNADYKNLVSYYMSLCYIGKDDLSSAKELLQNLNRQLSQSDPLRKKAEAIIDAIQ